MKAKQEVQLNQLQRLIDQVGKTSKDLGGVLPGEFLASVMSGKDPRPMDSPLYKLVRKIALREFSGGDPMPTPEEWEQIRTIVLESGLYRAARVPIEQSLAAAQKLMEFLHARLKAVEISGGLGVQMEVKPLTGAALDAFKKRFEDEF